MIQRLTDGIVFRPSSRDFHLNKVKLAIEAFEKIIFPAKEEIVGYLKSVLLSEEKLYRFLRLLDNTTFDLLEEDESLEKVPQEFKILATKAALACKFP